jgi:3'-phosphoadenosine 5'-phosphosulfate (PAPS) 3'-phosphatase
MAAARVDEHIMRTADIIGALEPASRSRVVSALDLFWRQAIGSSRVQGQVAALVKADSSPVTVVDLLHQTQLQEMLRREFPGDALLSEEPRNLQERHAREAGELSRAVYGVELEATIAELPTQGAVTWVLDPIDGTKGFLGGRYFALALACFIDGAPRFAVMAVPGGNSDRPLAIDRTIAFATSGGGAWISPVVEGGEPQWRPLPAGPPRTGSIRVAVSLAHGGPLADRLRSTPGLEVLELDSQAKYLAVAAGDIDAYLRAARDDGRSDLLWDHLPGALIAGEAGCEVRHFDGTPIVFEPREGIAFRGGVRCLRERAGAGVSAVVSSLTRGDVTTD